MEFLKKNAIALVWCIVELILGILLIVESENFIKVLAIIVGVIMIIGGVILTVTYFVTHAKEAEGKYLFNGLTYLALGIILCVKSNWLSSLMSLILLLLAVVLFIDGFEKIQEVCDKIRLKQKGWVAPLVGAAVEIVLAILVLVLDSQRWLFITLGVLVILEAVYNFVVLIFLNNVQNAVKKEAKKNGNVIDVDETKNIDDGENK
ncbi:MAG: DUF308 domain-containing protein [Clostridia bacterium]|nr:DUF308 domain-containing protein [Clostridia bacterium]